MFMYLVNLLLKSPLRSLRGSSLISIKLTATYTEEEKEEQEEQQQQQP